MNYAGTLRRIWLLIAQVIAVAAGLLIAWRAFGPPPVAAPHADGMALREAAAPAAMSASASASLVAVRLEAGFRAAARKASASVVNVYSRKAPPRRLGGGWRPYGDAEEDPNQGSSALGSGVIVAAQGYILTNNHVVAGADEIAVLLPDGRVAEARVVGTDPETDLSVLKVAGKDLQPIMFADLDTVQVGDIVLAVGDPFGVGQTVTQGIVSATGRKRLGINTFENFIQTDAAINGKELADTAALVAQTAALSPGTRVRFKMLRGGEPLTIGVELERRPPLPSR